ncbi:sulfatase [Rubripirellula obstinata]|nr:sulfatase [Rubripirellula obstinata]
MNPTPNMTRINTVRKSLFALTTMLVTIAIASFEFSSTASANDVVTDPPPNIVLIFADDLGWKDVGYQGDGFIETPNIDRLATEGMVFSSAYASAANCAPSRACLLSGTYTPRHHVYAVNSTRRGPIKNMRLIPPQNRSGIAAKNFTIAEAMKSAGYATGHFGKWHSAGKDGSLPTVQGFDTTYNTFGDGQVHASASDNKPGPPSDPKGVFTLTEKACEFMQNNQDRPFFCYLAHNAIHTPLQNQTATLEKFKQKKQKVASDGNGSASVSPKYAGMVYDFDVSVGRLLEKIDQLKLTKKTLVIFTSDNGAINQSPQEPLRGSKGGYYEGGIREPFIARWPGVIDPGSQCDVPITNVDFYPTFADVGRVKLPASKVLDGESIVPLFKGKNLTRKSVFWHFPGYLNRPVVRGRPSDVRLRFRSRPVTVIRKGDWKLHLFHEAWQLDGGREKIDTNEAVELYNLAEDIGERRDLALEEPDKRDELIDDLLAWIESTNAVIPSKPNPDYEPKR